MGKFFKYLIVIGVLYYGTRLLLAPDTAEANIAEQLAPGNTVVMYSLTTCIDKVSTHTTGYCAMVRRLAQAAALSRMTFRAQFTRCL